MSRLFVSYSGHVASTHVVPACQLTGDHYPILPTPHLLSALDFDRDEDGVPTTTLCIKVCVVPQ